MVRWRAPGALLLIAVLGTAGCSRYVWLDAALWPLSLPEAASAVDVEPGFVLLGGDLHCHVSPPDHPEHVVRALEDTLVDAQEAGLDFLVLTPHVWDGFELEGPRRRAEAGHLRDLRARARAQAPPGLMVDVGMEYSTRFGHLGLSFADVDVVLDDVSPGQAALDRAAFVRAWKERGGFVVVNHPLLEPLDVPVPAADWDLSFRPWTRPGQHPAHLVEVGGLAQGWEAYNVIVDELRDRFLQLDAGTSSRAVLARLDKEVVTTGRRMTPVGGSDSHSDDLRPTTWVLAKERSLEGVREALLAGRVCIREPGACSLRARPVRERGGAAVADKEWALPGATLAAGPVEVRATGDDIALVLDGVTVSEPESGEVVRIEPPASGCHTVRARVDGGDSGPIYVGCGPRPPGR